MSIHCYEVLKKIINTTKSIIKKTLECSYTVRWVVQEHLILPALWSSWSNSLGVVLWAGLEIVLLILAGIKLVFIALHDKAFSFSAAHLWMSF